MINFHLPTAFLIIGLLYVLLPVIAWIVLTEQRSQPVAMWCLGGLLMGMAAILTAMQGTLKEKILFSVATFLFHSSNLLRIQSLRIELGIAWKTRWLVLALIIIMVIFHILHFVLALPTLRGQFTFLVGAALIFHMAMLARQIGLDQQSPSAKWIGRVYVLVAFAMLYRVWSLIDFNGNVGVINEGISSQLLASVMLLAVVVGHVGYVGLHLDRLMGRELKAAADRARDEESRRLGEQIAQLDRQRSLGEMSASLGHELNQPLTAVLTNAQVARRGLQAGRYSEEQHTEFLDKIILNTQRANQIIERIRGFIRPSTVLREPIDLHQIVREVSELVADKVRSEQIRIILPETFRPLRVSGDPIQLSQIVLNVLRNAIEAVKQVAHREIRFSLTQIDQWAVLRLEDSGPGLTPELLAQVGTPFFSTKPSGLGMGVSISRAIATQHGGTLNIVNATTRGTVVELRLPILPDGGMR
ncbi:MAG: ATP-binding protein [Rhodocyclaceae bacterium]|nr:ATP-binding protein [Rhodocyclaceae bacterium]